MGDNDKQKEEGQLTLDVFQTDEHIVIQSTIAGVSRDNIDVAITNDMVTIRGERTKDSSLGQSEYFHQELFWGPFSRSVILPVEIDADSAKASIKHGILTIRLPKAENLRTKKIKIE